MSDYIISPDEYSQLQNISLIKIDADYQAKIDSLNQQIEIIENNSKGYNSLILTGLITAILLLYCRISIIGTPLFLGVVIYWIIYYKKTHKQNTETISRSEITQLIDSLSQQRDREKKEIIERIQQYRIGYYSFHSQRLAEELSSSEAVKAIAGQLYLLFKKAIENADRNSYIKTIIIVMNICVFSQGLQYSFTQKGTIEHTSSSKAFVSFEKYGISNLEKQEEQNGVCKAISSLIQASLIENYLNDNSTPTVEIKIIKPTNNKLSFYNTQENNCNITYSLDNPNYEINQIAEI